MLTYFKKLDIFLLFSIGILSIASLVTIASVASNLFTQQLFSFILGWSIMAMAVFFDVRPIFKHRFFVMSLYFLAIFLLLATLFFAPTIRHTKSWIVIGPIQFQTSEFAKLALMVTLAYFFAKRHVGIAYVKNILIPLAYLSVPLVLILKQPDLGSGLILLGLFVGFLFFSGLRPQHLALGILILAFFSFWAWGSFLKPYQKERVEALFYPNRDPLGINYNTIQSKIAIGSGGFFGKGFGQGTEAQLKFLPEAQTDFIFAAIVEEWGLLGGLVVLGSFAIMLLRIAFIGISMPDNFGKLVCLGTMAMFLLHFTFNIGSVLGLLPVVGVPLPFLSYGGSNLLVSFLLIAIIESMALRANF